MGYNAKAADTIQEVATVWERFKAEKHLSDDYTIKTIPIGGGIKLYIYDAPKGKIYFSETNLEAGIGLWAESILSRWWDMTGEISSPLEDAFKKQYEG